MTRRAMLGTATAAVVGALVALLVDDVAHLARLGPAPSAIARGVAISAALAAAQVVVWLAVTKTEAPRARVAGAAAIVAGVTTLVAATSAGPWVSLSAFGAGPLGELALIVLPLSQVLAMLMGSGVIQRAAPRERA